MIATTLLLQLFPARAIPSRSRREPPRRALTVTTCGGGAAYKHSGRFLTSLATVAGAGDDSATDRLIRRFVKSSSKSVSLTALSRLLSLDSVSHANLSPLALPLYSQITEASWFGWNPKLVAEVIALLEKQGLHREAQILFSDAVSKTMHQERDMAHLFSNLINFHSKHKNKRGFDDLCSRLTQILGSTKSSYVRRQCYESLVVGFCVMGQPREAEDVIEEMKEKGLTPSKQIFKYVVYAYGQLGSFEEMSRSVQKMEQTGFSVDIICSNMILSSYGAHGKLVEMVSWLRLMKSSGIDLSIQTYNTVLKSCPVFMSSLQDLKTLHVSLEGLEQILDFHEGLVVKELVGSSVLEGSMVWGNSEVKLDLHGMHSGSAYLIMLQWMQEMQHRLGNGNCTVPAQVSVISGSGKHSIVRGKSPVKEMVKELMIRTKSPLKIDRQNIGCFVAKTKVVKNWLDSFVKIA